MIRCCSVDVGKKNFSVYIEEFNRKELNLIPPEVCYNSNGTATEEMETVLTSIYKNGKILLHKNVDLTENCNTKLKLDPISFLNMNKFLEEYKEIFDTCQIILIEQQMSFGKRLNLMAVKLAQHCFSWFIIMYKGQKIVEEFPAYHKTQVLGAEKQAGKMTKNGKIRYKAVDKPARKKWAVKKLKEILILRNETEVLESLKSIKKLDDLADTLLMVQAYKFLTYVKE